MTPLSQQLQALRTPSDLDALQNEELHYHITHNVLRFLDKVPAKTLAIGDDKSSQDLLQSLEPDADTLPYLYVLLAQIDAAVGSTKDTSLPSILGPGGHFWQHLNSFIAQFDPIQIRYAGTKWSELMGVLSRLIQHGTAPAALDLFRNAIIRLDPTNGTFTTTHLHYIRHCLRAHSFPAARAILKRDLHSLPAKDFPEGTFPCSPHEKSNGFLTLSSRLTGKVGLDEALEYHLLGAMAYIGLREWSEASYHLEHVLSTPTSNVAHALMLEAYRKWILVQLLLHGKLSSLPKSTSPSAIKIIRSITKPYEAIVEAFREDESRKLYAEVQEAQAIFNDDGNFGLVRHVLDRHKELSVIRLGSIYAAVPLSMLTANLNMSSSDVQVFLTTLIKNGRLNAQVEQDATMPNSIVVRFPDQSINDIFPKSEDQSRLELADQTARIKLLAHDVGEADRRLGLATEYQEYVRRSRKATDQERGSPNRDGMDMSYAMGVPSDDDENVMEDVV